MSVARDIAGARELFEKAEREKDPELKARALREALLLLPSLDLKKISNIDRKLIVNLRIAHTRRLLVQLVSLTSISMDVWSDYVRLLFGELSRDVERLVESDADLKQNYERFLNRWGPRVAQIMTGRQTDAP